MSDITIGHFPYKPGFNPYQRLFADGLESAGLKVVRIPPRKFMPLHFALSHPVDLLQMDWPHDWYRGRTAFLTAAKRIMYFLGLRKLKRWPCVWTAHNIIAHDEPNVNDEIRMMQKLINCCNGIIVMSRAADAALRQTYRIGGATHIAVIPHGHYIDAYPNDVSRGQARRKLGISAAARVVLFLGRILRYKGADTLVDSFCEMARDGDFLILAGPTPGPQLAGELQRKAAERSPAGAEVRIHPGLVPDDELQVYFQACDLVALPFRHILHSGGLLLAMSFGRCVVAPRMGSIPEVACPEAYFGYDPKDPDGLSAALRLALDQPDLLERGAASMQFARERYDWGDIGRKVRAMYEEILGRS